MKVSVFDNKEELGRDAAEKAAEFLRRRIEEKGEATCIAATGASQFEFLAHLAKQPDVPWDQVRFFHLDEYVGLSDSHPASFRKYLRERLVSPLKPGEFIFVRGDAPDPERECRRLKSLIQDEEIDIAFIGIGENGHIAFNDPPADFETKEPFLVVELDEDCRKQQLGEGWFDSLDEVPRKAITMSVQQILEAEKILCIVPDRRKAEAVRNCLEAEISPRVPCSILRRHPEVELFLDRESSSQLERIPE